MSVELLLELKIPRRFADNKMITGSFDGGVKGKRW
jgi:hypothetical protein